MRVQGLQNVGVEGAKGKCTHGLKGAMSLNYTAGSEGTGWLRVQSR